MPDPLTNANDFLYHTINPVLDEISMNSAAASKLLMMTATHESAGFRYRTQIGGAALSYYQMEPATLNDLYDNYLSFRPDRQALLDKYLPDDMTREEALEKKDDYATSAARLQYSRVPVALPDVGDDEALAKYAKQYWNTALGAATWEKYLADFYRYGPVPTPANWA